uniref:Uncharacterized protein n=1 Tax=Aegilops tauschii subsp. strangulata TaxID=200361 RepID=A0A453Q9G3_AEGTS
MHYPSAAFSILDIMRVNMFVYIALCNNHTSHNPVLILHPGPGGGWETIENKKKKSGQTWAPRTSSSNAPPATARQAWNGNGSSRPSGNNSAQPSGRGPAARHNPRVSSQARFTEPGLQAPNPAVTPPLVNGWQWASRPRPCRPRSNNDDDVASSGFDPEMDDPQVEDSS